MSRWARAVVFALGCGHAPAPPPAPGSTHAASAPSDAPLVDAAPAALEDDLPRLAERAVKLFQAWQRALVDANGDCAFATNRLNQLALDYSDVIDANARIAHAGHTKIAALRAELAKHDDEMDAAAQAIVHSPTMSKCSSDKAFSSAIDRIGGSP